MTFDDLTTTPHRAPGTSDPTRALATLVDAAELAVVVLGVDGTLLHANTFGARLFHLSSGQSTVVSDALAVVLDQVPKQLTAGPEGGTWTGEISLGATLERPSIHAVTVHAHHDPAQPAGDCRDPGRRRDPRAPERDRVVFQLRRRQTTGLLNRSAAIARIGAALADEPTGPAILMIDVDRRRRERRARLTPATVSWHRPGAPPQHRR
ncbi:MAG: hypothetical protein R2697_07655 [Ilumatobacteraceae bacterium]